MAILPPIIGSPINTKTAGSTPAILPQKPKPVVTVPQVPASPISQVTVPAPVKSVASKTVKTAPLAKAKASPVPAPAPTPMVELTNSQTGQKISVSKQDYDTNPAYKDPSNPWLTPEDKAIADKTAADKATADKATADKNAADKQAADEQLLADNNQTVNSYLNAGYDNINDIATATGLSTDDINTAISNDEGASYKMKINNQINKAEQYFVDSQTKLDNIANGIFTLSDPENAQIQAIKNLYQQMADDQRRVNQNYEGAMQTAEIRSGRMEFMNQISGGIMKGAVDDGLAKIQDIETQSLDKVNELKLAFQDKKYTAASDAYDQLQKYMTDKTAAIKDIHTAVQEQAKAVADAAKAAQEQITQDLENEKLKQDISKTLIEGLTPALGGANQENIDTIAKFYGLDSNLLMGSVMGEQNKFEKDLVSKGFRTINPVDVTRMRESGADVIEYNGRAYAKEPELKAFTNKGNVDFFRGIKKVGTSGLTGGGPVGAKSADQKEIDAFNADLKEVRQKVAAGTYMLDDARNYIKSQYGLTDENAAIAIPDYSSE